ncbi:MAG: enoyl-CoA hydratase [Candidatus Tectimicrobiota bacterium]|nr:MAG: enoyl-CoA hydratase [Candidatus Tectomicrobia bacterium]
MSSPVLCQRQPHITTLVLNRPEKHNALSPELLQCLHDTLQQLAAEGTTRVLILRGQGTQAFSSGYDIARLPQRSPEQPPPQDDGTGLFARVLAAVQAFPAPVLAMIYGFCMGGGLELAAACDVRLAADTARFCMPPARLGVLYSGEGLLRFINLIGIANTSEIFFTACTFDAQRAHAMGLVNHVVPAAELEACTYAMASQIARNAPLSVQFTKRVLALVQRFQDFSAHAEEIRRLRQRCLQSEDFQEGRRAFLEKRPPRFQGR